MDGRALGSVDIAIYDQDPEYKTEFLGRFTLPLLSITNAHATPAYYKLQNAQAEDSARDLGVHRDLGGLTFTPMGVNSMSPARLHVQPMGVHRTCRWADNIKENTKPKHATALFCLPQAVKLTFKFEHNLNPTLLQPLATLQPLLARGDTHRAAIEARRGKGAGVSTVSVMAELTRGKTNAGKVASLLVSLDGYFTWQCVG